MKKIIVIDFAGTLVKAKMIEEANKFRSKILQRSLPSKKEHAKSEKMYKVNREFVEKLTGLNKKMKIFYRENDNDFIVLKGEDYQNQISTDLFRIGMYGVAKKYKMKIFSDDFISVLKKLKKKYKLAIVSGVRTDIVSGMLEISGLGWKFFDYIYAQPPILGVSNEENLKDLQKKGKISFLIGDKFSDLKPAKKLKCKSIFVKWGHATGGEEKFADFTVKSAKELVKIL